MNGGSEGGSGAGTPTSDKNHTDNGRHEREVNINLKMVYGISEHLYDIFK